MIMIIIIIIIITIDNYRVYYYSYYRLHHYPHIPSSRLHHRVDYSYIIVLSINFNTFYLSMYTK